MPTVPAARIRRLHDAPPNPRGRYVLYWMIAQRRLRHSFALDHAVALARAQDAPLLIFEPLRLGYPHASARLHTFLLQGMEDNAAEAARHGVRYLPYVEPTADAGKGLLRALAEEACAVVTDDHVVFHYPALLAAASTQVPVAFDAVDGNGLLPFRSTEKAYATAHALRRHLQTALPDHLEQLPSPAPLRALRGMPSAVVPRAALRAWPSARGVEGLDLDHAVAAVDRRGGPEAGRARLDAFVAARLDAYAQERNDPDKDAASGLSPYLHFGHVGAHEVFAAVTRHEGWTPDDVGTVTDGRRSGWWGMSESAEAFLDQLVTWRELGVNVCVHRPADYAALGSLPAWAQATLAKHARDVRAYRYDLADFEAARTHDEIWNAAQRELRREGRIHNYLRMLWGKKILEWTASPEEALAVMIHLNDKYALDGRDPNSYSGILWCLGRHDRAWGPERPVFGTVRFMSSDSTRRKLKLRGYLERYAGEDAGGRLF